MGKGLSITAFVLSFILPFVGLILGIIALSIGKKDEDYGKGLAIAAIVIGGALVLILIVLLIIGASLFLMSSPINIEKSDQIGEALEDLFKNSCQIAPPFSCRDDFRVYENEIYITLINTGTKSLEITSISVDGCTEYSDNLSFASGESVSVGFSCNEVILDKGINQKTIEIKYSYDGSTLELTSYGTIFFKAFTNS